MREWQAKLRVAAYCRVSTDSDEQATEILEYDEQLVRRLIEKVTVYDERFEVEFKTKVKIEVDRKI